MNINNIDSIDEVDKEQMWELRPKVMMKEKVMLKHVIIQKSNRFTISWIEFVNAKIQDGNWITWAFPCWEYRWGPKWYWTTYLICSDWIKFAKVHTDRLDNHLDQVQN